MSRQLVDRNITVRHGNMYSVRLVRAYLSLDPNATKNGAVARCRRRYGDEARLHQCRE